MKITHVITRLVVGGAQENTLSTVRGLRARAGLDVKLISGPTTGPEGSLENSAREIFADALQDFTIVPELVRPVHPIKDFIALRKLEKILRAQQPDLVHTHSGKAGILGRLAARRAGVPVIVHSIHGPSFGNFQGAAANLVFTAAEKYAARATDHFIVVADAMRRRYVAAGIGRDENYTRIFSGFDLQPFLAAQPDAALRKQLGFAPDDFVIGQIARFVPRKGHADLFSVLKMVLPDHPNARLLLLGGGPLRAELEHLAQTLGLADKIVFAGLVPPGDVPRYAGVMDCVAHLSTFPEGLPRALPQALAAGKPIIAYDFDGADEICRDNETGFLIPTGNINLAAQKLAQLIAAPALREQFGQTGRQFVRDNFSVEKMVDDQCVLYHKLAAKAGVQASACSPRPAG